MTTQKTLRSQLVLRRRVANARRNASPMPRRPLLKLTQALTRPAIVKKLALAALLSIPTLRTFAQPYGGIEPSPNPAIRARVNDAQITYMHGQKFNQPASGFDHTRLSYKLDLQPAGPVVIFERNYPQGKRPEGVRIGMASEQTLPGGIVARLGLLSPQLTGNAKFANSDFGIIITQPDLPFGFEAHLKTGGEVNRFSAGFDLKKPNIPGVEYSYGGAGYFGPQPTHRFAFNDLQRLGRPAGINFGKLSTGLGFNLPEHGNKSFVDVYAITPLTRDGRVSLGASATRGLNENAFGVKGFVVFNIGSGKRK